MWETRRAFRFIQESYDPRDLFHLTVGLWIAIQDYVTKYTQKRRGKKK